jgi:hypothetical protein
MTDVESGSEILRTDKRGRVWMRPERRQELLDEFDRSGLSVPKFAAVTGLKYQTLAGWLARRRKEQALGAQVLTGGVKRPVQWFEAVVDRAQVGAAALGPALVVRLPSGAVVEIGSATQVPLAAAVLRAWEKAGC